MHVSEEVLEKMIKEMVKEVLEDDLKDDPELIAQQEKYWKDQDDIIDNGGFECGICGAGVLAKNMLPFEPKEKGYYKHTRLYCGSCGQFSSVRFSKRFGYEVTDKYGIFTRDYT